MKIIHYASKISTDGRISALCFKKPRAIALGKATWTLGRASVTCKKCLLVFDGVDKLLAQPFLPDSPPSIVPSTGTEKVK